MGTPVFRTIQPRVLPADTRFAVVVARYNEAITRRLLDGALATFRASGVSDDAIDVVWVPGAWEIPVVVQRLGRGHRYAAIVCLGAVIRGETSHDEHINRQVSHSLGHLALELDLPVAFGVLTCHNWEQALNRAGGNAGNKGSESAAAALEMAGLLKALDP
ncbi:MAG TPA: 6,7-dimethyl-8-ribityllumazine synthase [Pirellulaceae bacterium]